MHCPKCGYKLLCGCSTCKKELPEGTKTEIWIGGHYIQCPNCQFTKHCCWWEDLAFDVAVGMCGGLTNSSEEKNKEIIQKIIDEEKYGKAETTHGE